MNMPKSLSNALVLCMLVILLVLQYKIWFSHNGIKKHNSLSEEQSILLLKRDKLFRNTPLDKTLRQCVKNLDY